MLLMGLLVTAVMPAPSWVVHASRSSEHVQRTPWVKVKGEWGMNRGPSARMVAGVAALIGATIGAATATSELLLRPLQLGEMGIVTMLSDGPAPKLVTSEISFNFGRMAVGDKGTHEFPFTNTGDVPLELSKGATSCKCTISGLEETLIAPGETANVKLEWTANPGGPGGDFRQTALILTNDPLRPEVTLSIEGKTFTMWDPYPQGVTFTDLQADAVASATARIMTFGDNPPVVTSIRVSQESNVVVNPVDQGENEVAEAAEVPDSPYFTAKAEPLDEALVASIPGATGGLLVTVTSVPPLPPGPMTNQLEVVFTFNGSGLSSVLSSVKEPEGGWIAKLGVKANVVGPLAVAGAVWDAANELVRIGPVSTVTGYQTKLFVTAKGEHRNAVKPRVIERVPESMQVEIGEAAAIGDGVVVRFPLSISIPAGSPTCNHLGSQQGKLGRIVLETGHPDMPQLTIPVRVAVSP
jgi:hypothetical protein